MTNLEAAKKIFNILHDPHLSWTQESVDVFDMAISALQAQEAKTQLSAEGTTSDLISRQDAIDALMDFDKKLRKINWYQYPHTEYECRGVDEAIIKIENVPSAQPEIEKRKEESAQNVPKEDLISRKAAIDAALSAFSRGLLASPDIRKLPPVQPEREKGEWTKDCACEICGFKPWYERDIHTLSFCPNCGADMRGDDHDQSK